MKKSNIGLLRFLTSGLYACGLVLAMPQAWADSTVQVKSSLPFLVVDLDGTGIETIPLKDSKVYTDVDGDGMAEHTAWIKPNEAFLGILSRDEDQNLHATSKRFTAAYTSGTKKLLMYDKNKDGKYDKNDYRPYIDQHEHKQFRELAFYIALDKNSEGFPEAGRYKGVPCDFQSLDYNVDSSGGATGVIHCSDRSYKFKELRFQYEDKHVVWSDMCKKIRFLSEQEYYQKNCLEKGFDPSK